MSASSGGVASVSHFVHRHFFGLLIGAYALAAAVPEAGQRLSGLSGTLCVFGADVRVSAPAALLGVLLFAAGLAVKWEHLRDILWRPCALGIGLAASIMAPLFVILLVGPLLALWHDPAEARDLMVGLAVVAAMPVAGSSAGWSRALDGDCALSLGLVLVSTMLSPFTTPMVLQAAEGCAPDMTQGTLSQLADSGSAAVFVGVWVVLPTLTGLLARGLIGGRRVDRIGPSMRAVTSLVLLTLCYTNASACLPGVVAEPDWDFLILVVMAASVMCIVAFAAGFGSARAVRADPARRTSLVFGVGMANNGAGLALAAGMMVGTPMALLPMVAVNLIQHLAAGFAGGRLRSHAGREKDPGRSATDAG